MTQPDLFEFGYVAQVHGLNGEVGVKTFDRASQALFEVKSVVLRRREQADITLKVKETRPGRQGSTLVVFAGVHTRAAALPLRGATLLARRHDLPPPAKGEYFAGDLTGLTVENLAGEVIGTVEGLQSFGPVPNLVIRTDTGGELLIPFAQDFVRAVELKLGHLVVDWQRSEA